MGKLPTPLPAMYKERKKIARRLAVVALGSATALACGACGLFGGSKEPAAAPPPCTTPEPLSMSLRASPRLNPGERGEGLSTVVRIYQLNGTSKVLDLGFDDMLEKDKEMLGDTLVSATEVTLQPGETRALDEPRKPDVTHVAVVALFRQPAGTSWRAVQPLPAADAEHCRRKPKRGVAPRDAVTAVLDENRIELR